MEFWYLKKTRSHFFYIWNWHESLNINLIFPSKSRYLLYENLLYFILIEIYYFRINQSPPFWHSHRYSKADCQGVPLIAETYGSHSERRQKYTLDCEGVFPTIWYDEILGFTLAWIEEVSTKNSCTQRPHCPYSATKLKTTLK